MARCNSPPPAEASSVSAGAPVCSLSTATANHISSGAAGWRMTDGQGSIERVVGQLKSQKQYLRKMNGALMRHWILNDNRMFMRGDLRRLMNNREAVARRGQVNSPGCAESSAQGQNSYRPTFRGSRLASGEGHHGRRANKGQQAQSPGQHQAWSRTGVTDTGQG